MNVYTHELKMARSAMVWWIVALVTITTLFLSIFPAFSHDVESSRQLLAGFPPQLRAMFGLSLATFFTFLGFYAYVFTYIGLAGAVQAMNLGLTMLSREASSKTSDFLLTKPVTRSKIFANKLLAALTVLIVTNVVLVVVTLLLAKAFGAGNFNLYVFGLLSLAFYLVQLIFLSIGILVSQLMHIRSIIALSLGIVFGFFVVGMIQSLTNDEVLRYVTPFKFFDHLKIVTDKAYEMQFVWLAIGVIAASIVVAYSIYLRRDTRSAA